MPPLQRQADFLSDSEHSQESAVPTLVDALHKQQQERSFANMHSTPHQDKKIVAFFAAFLVMDFLVCGLIIKILISDLLRILCLKYFGS